MPWRRAGRRAPHCTQEARKKGAESAYALTEASASKAVAGDRGRAGEGFGTEVKVERNSVWASGALTTEKEVEMATYVRQGLAGQSLQTQGRVHVGTQAPPGTLSRRWAVKGKDSGPCASVF